MQVLSPEGKNLYGKNGAVEQIRIAQGAFTELTRLATTQSAEECCGLLAGRGGVVTQLLKARNAAENPATAYEIAPPELFKLMRGIRETGLEFLGIYHSHPVGDNQPSAHDVERAYYPDAAYFILSACADAGHAVRAFSIRDGRWMELKIEIV